MEHFTQSCFTLIFVIVGRFTCHVHTDNFSLSNFPIQDIFSSTKSPNILIWDHNPTELEDTVVEIFDNSTLDQNESAKQVSFDDDDAPSSNPRYRKRFGTYGGWGAGGGSHNYGGYGNSGWGHGHGHKAKPKGGMKNDHAPYNFYAKICSCFRKA